MTLVYFLRSTSSEILIELTIPRESDTAFILFGKRSFKRISSGVSRQRYRSIDKIIPVHLRLEENTGT